MSDALDLSPSIDAVVGEYRRLQRQLESKKARLDQLLAPNAEAGDFPADFEGAVPRRYSIDFRFSPGDTTPQEVSVQVDIGTAFRCAYIESFVRAIGTANDPYTGTSTTVQVTLDWSNRLSTFDYFWKVRDTGTDREWCDRPQPALFGGGGYVGPLWLPRRVVLGGGAAIFAQVTPTRTQVNAPNGSWFSGGTINEFNLQISFVGHEVPDTEPV